MPFGTLWLIYVLFGHCSHNTTPYNQDKALAMSCVCPGCNASSIRSVRGKYELSAKPYTRFDVQKQAWCERKWFCDVCTKTCRDPTAQRWYCSKFGKDICKSCHRSNVVKLHRTTVFVVLLSAERLKLLLPHLPEEVWVRILLQAMLPTKSVCDVMAIAAPFSKMWSITSRAIAPEPYQNPIDICEKCKRSILDPCERECCQDQEDWDTCDACLNACRRPYGGYLCSGCIGCLKRMNEL